MAGLLDFILGQGGNGLLGGPGSMNASAGDPSQTQSPGMTAYAQAAPQQGVQMPGGGMLDAISILNPQLGNQMYQRQMMQSALKAMVAPKESGGAGLSVPQAIIAMQNPKVQEQLFGVQSLGVGKSPGGYEGQIVNRGGQIGMAFPTPNGQAPADANARTVKPFESIVDLSKPQAVAQGGQPLQSGQPGQANTLYSNNGALDKTTVEYTAKQLLAGDDSGLKNNRTTEGAMFNAAVRQRAVQLAQENNIPPEELASRNAEYKGYNSSQTTLGNRLGTVSLAINEAKQLIPQALEASNNVKRVLNGQYMPVNKIVNAYQENTGDPNIIKLGAALYGLAHTYARAVNPTGAIADADVERAYKILDTGLSKGQLSGGISQIYQEMQAAGKSPGAVKQEFREQFTNNAGLAGKNNADVLNQAKEAISKGAPRDAVIKRLQERGISADGL